LIRNIEEYIINYITTSHCYIIYQTIDNLLNSNTPFKQLTAAEADAQMFKI